jgi:hypothetical protein
MILLSNVRMSVNAAHQRARRDISEFMRPVVRALRGNRLLAAD